MLDLTQSQEDYLESIFIISKKNGSQGARIKDLVALFNVKAPSVVEVISVLKKKQLVTQQPYKPVMLTDIGYKHAKDVYIRHNKIKDFLQQVLFLDEEISEKSACSMEHCLCKNVISRMVNFMEVYQRNIPKSMMDIINSEVLNSGS